MSPSLISPALCAAANASTVFNFDSDGLGTSTAFTDTVDNLVIFITAKTISAEGAPVEQVFNSQEVREFKLKRSEMPGYRDGTDPFIDESPQPPKRGGNQ